MEKAAERRRMQNRVAQRNHRENMKKRITNLEKTNEYLVSKIFQENVAPNPNAASQTIDIERYLREHEIEQFYQEPMTINTQSSKNKSPKISPSLDSHVCNGCHDMEGDVSDMLNSIISNVDLELISSSHQNHISHDSNETAAAALEAPVSMGDVQNHCKVSDGRPSVFNTSQDRIQEALRVAVANSHIECVDVLLSSGANVDQVDNNGRSLLHLCSETGNAIVAQHLIQNGANTEVRDRWGLTPLLLAAHTGSAEVIKILIE